jgi:outer membrane protein insertion porin family
MTKAQLSSFFLLILFTTSCSNTKYLTEGEFLYTGAKIELQDKVTSKKERNNLKSELQKLVRPKPNSTLLGIRTKLWIYNLAGTPKKEKGLRYWLKNKIGEAPVLMSQVDLVNNKNLLQNYVENKGYFNAKISIDTTLKAKNKAIIYTVNPLTQYKIRAIKLPQDSSTLSSTIRNSSHSSLLKIEKGFSLDLIKKERIRIDAKLKENGFYYFGPDYLKFQVDSTVADHRVDLILKVKKDAPSIAKKQFKINKTFVYSNYTIGSDTLTSNSEAKERHPNFSVIDPQNTFNPQVFEHALYFKKNDLYNRTNHNLSLKQLVNLGTFKFVKNEFKIADTIGNYLDAYYYLSPLTKKSIQLELTAKSNSANYNGTELNANWNNRNTFKGAELLSVSLFGGFEVQVSGQNNGFNIYRLGTETNLVWPRIIAPFTFETLNGYVPKTKATLGYEFQKRTQLYSLNTFKGIFGYLWKSSERKEHNLNLTEITFASPQHVTALYQEQIKENPSLAKVIEKQLIFGPSYSYTYSNTLQKKKRNTFYYKGSIDLSATITGLITGANLDKKDTLKIFGVPFSQFIKLENEFRHYIKIGKNNQLVSRAIIGAGFAYGNSREIPFIKQFFIGGTNSIRAFRARSIGPGSYLDPNNNTDSFSEDQSGDIKFEFDTEYRTHLLGPINGAIFLDAGNIWLLNENPTKPGSQFSSSFMKEMAVGTGIGLRFDLTFLILRTDFAFPIRKPYLPEGNRWVFDQINFGSNAWLRENLTFNLAIGYPF